MRYIYPILLNLYVTVGHDKMGRPLHDINTGVFNIHPFQIVSFVRSNLDGTLVTFTDGNVYHFAITFKMFYEIYSSLITVDERVKDEVDSYYNDNLKSLINNIRDGNIGGFKDDPGLYPEGAPN